ncbi:hypothetical protein BS78_06G059300 [Paspalum vaginatum]|nr:hypothetical protein BS78_06G059300 [Paspalum vaginatum]
MSARPHPVALPLALRVPPQPPHPRCPPPFPATPTRRRTLRDACFPLQTAIPSHVIPAPLQKPPPRTETPSAVRPPRPSRRLCRPTAATPHAAGARPPSATVVASPSLVPPSHRPPRVPARGPGGRRLPLPTRQRSIMAGLRLHHRRIDLSASPFTDPEAAAFGLPCGGGCIKAGLFCLTYNCIVAPPHTYIPPRATIDNRQVVLASAHYLLSLQLRKGRERETNTFAGLTAARFHHICCDGHFLYRRQIISKLSHRWTLPKVMVMVAALHLETCQTPPMEVVKMTEVCAHTLSMLRNGRGKGKKKDGHQCLPNKGVRKTRRDVKLDSDKNVKPHSLSLYEMESPVHTMKTWILKIMRNGCIGMRLPHMISINYLVLWYCYLVFLCM